MEAHQSHDGGAVRIRDDALGMLPGGFRIDFGNHQRDFGIHPEGGGVVDHDRPGRGCRRRKLPGEPSPGTEERDVDPLEGTVSQLPDRDLFPSKAKRSAHRTSRGQQREPADWKVALLEALQHLRPDGARGAGDGYMV